MNRCFHRLAQWLSVAGLLFSARWLGAADSWRAAVEADWLRQAAAWLPRPTPTQADAAGAVDGVKNGKYGFHTAQELNPWWQVDLGRTQTLGRIVVFNRLDYPPGLHNADTLRVLVSEDGQRWRLIHDQAGQHFGGVSGAPPLELHLTNAEVRARFVRLQLHSPKPVFFHLDEVEVYGRDEPTRNLALGQLADQSSVSVWSVAKQPARPPGQPISPAAIWHFVHCGQRLIAELRMAGAATGPAERQLAEVEAELSQWERSGSEVPAETKLRLYLKSRWAVRRLVFGLPAMQLDRLLIYKRFGQETYPDVCLNHMPWVSRPGGDLCILTLAGAEQPPQVQNILRGALGTGHVHGMDLSWDGQRIVFGYAKAKSSQPPAGWLDRRESWRLRRTEEPIHLFEIGVDGTGLRQLTFGPWSDLDPTYAPNGDIVFVSERCATSLQCNEYDKDETSCNLYSVRPDGSSLRRLSVNKDGDYLPHTLDDGTIGYTRWEYHERSWAYIQALWTIRPDGTQADALFKQHFVNPWALEDVRSVPGIQNQRLVAVAAGHHTLAAGPVVLITPAGGPNDPRGIQIVTPDVLPPEGGMDGAAVPEGGVRDPGGYYMHPWPLSEKTFLVSYTYGPGKTGPGSEVDPTGYAIYLIDVRGAKELIYRDPEISCFCPIPLRPRPRPPVLPDRTLYGEAAEVPTAAEALASSSSPNASVHPGLHESGGQQTNRPAGSSGLDSSASATGYATCLVSTVSYGCDGLEPERIRWLRIAEPVGWPYDLEYGGLRYGEDHRYGGPDAARRNLTSWTPIRVLGDVPVEPDGSAYFRVPADTAVYFQILDANRQELRRMRSFISFQPGEVRACSGCHETRAVAPVPSRYAVQQALSRPPSDPQPPPWGDRPISFLRDIQPVLDRHCVRCHSGLKPAGNIDLSGGLIAYDPEVPGYGHNRAYETILEKGLVSISPVRAQDASVTPPLAYGSLKSKLVTCLTDATHRTAVTLGEEERLRLVMWIDANAPYHDRFVNKRSPNPVYDLAADRALRQRLQALHQRRCTPCHAAEQVSRLDWIDLQAPAGSLFLSAPLARSAGGLGRCSRPVYADTSDPDYRTALDWVEAAVQRAWREPRRDLVAR